MGKLIRFLGFLLGILVVLVVGLSIVLPLLLDPNDYKDEIASAVEDRTGRKLAIGGDIGLTVFPWLGLEIADVQLSNAEGFGEAPFARIDTAKVRVKLLPLLRKEVEMDTVSLEGLQLNLARDKMGRSNWQDLAGKETQPSEAAAGGEPVSLAGLAVGGVRLQDARVVWDDRSSGSRYVVDNLSLSSDAVRLDLPFDVQLAFELQSTAPEVRAGVTASGKLTLSESLQQFRIGGLKAGLEAKGKALPGGELKAGMQTDVDLDLDRQTVQLARLGIEVFDVQIDGALNGSKILGNAPRFSGTLDLQEFAPRAVMKALGQPVPETADKGVLEAADGHLEISAGTDDLQVDKVRIRFDDTEVSGNFSVRHFAAPAITVKLAADTIDLDRYLPPPEKGKVSAAPAPATGAAAAGTALPVETLRQLNLSGDLKIGSLKAFGIRSSDITLQLNARDGKLRLHPASAKMYRGTYNGDITIDASGDRPRLSANESVTDVQAGPLLKDLTGDDKLSGTANVKLALTATGADAVAMRKTLNGNSSFSFTDGAVKGVNIAKVVREAKARLEGRPLPKNAGPDRTDFSELGGTANIVNGVVNNDDFLAQSPLLRLAGKGSVDLVRETIDYLLTVKLVGSLKGQGGEGLDKLKGVAIPVRVGGTFAKPTWRPDLEAALGEAVKAKVEEKKEEVKEKVEEKVREKLKDKVDDQLQEQLEEGLKGLF